MTGTDVVHVSGRPPADLPADRNLSMISFLFDRTRSIPTRPALVDAATGRSLTFRDLRASVARVAHGLRCRLGVGPGDVVLVFAPNSIDFAVSFLSIVAVGAVATTVNPLYTVAELTKQVKDCGARLAFTVPELLEKVGKLQIPVVLITGDGRSDAVRYHGASVSVTYLADLLADGSGEERFEVTAPSDRNINNDGVAALLYSSGTTGVNKGVVLTHRNFISATLAVIMEQDVRGDPPNVALCFLPMFHIFGLCIATYAQLCRGNTVVVMAKFDMEMMLRSVERYMVSYIFVVPPVMVALAKQGEVKKFNLSSLRVLLSGAAPLSKDVMVEVAHFYPHVDVLQGYGLTESCGIISFENPVAGTIHYGSSGNLVSSIEGKVIDVDSFKPLPANQQGELCFRGPNIMQGYFHNPEASAATLDKDGWLHTGDLGYFDDQGRLYVVDRIKELIKYKGFQIAPAELEGLLLSHSEILDAVVIPLPHDEVGEVPISYVVKSHNSMLTEEDVKTFVSKEVAPYKRLRRVTFVDSVPKSASGKILRRELIQKVRSRL